MRSRVFSVLAVGVALIVCAVLTARWVQGRARSEQLTAELEDLRRAADARSTHPSTRVELPAPAEPAATVDPEFEARRALLAEARAIPELARREAALLAVRRIKARHEAAPPPARPLPPPLGAKYGAYFPELFSDPGYLALVHEDWKAGVGSTRMQRLDRLGVSEETRQQVLDIEFDSFLAHAEIGNYTTVEEQQAAFQERRHIQEENKARVRQLLGEEGFRTYAGTSPPGAPTPTGPGPTEAVAQMIHAEVTTGPLATRLSYSDAPLTDADREKLQALLSVLVTPKTPAYRLWYDVEFFKQAQSILNPTQLAALRQLQEEKEAWRLRAQLPKSSELPRTTRRARLDPGDGI